MTESGAIAAGTAGRTFPLRPVIAWCFYDWANSPFPTVVTTFIFGAYFTQAVAADPAAAEGQWGLANGIAALSVAILSPALGAIADHTGRRKPWLAIFTGVMIAASALLWFVRPHASDTFLLLALVCLGTIGFELGMVFYNAMLPGLAPPGFVGRVSGWAWGLGYVGGLVCLLLILFGFVQADPAPFGLDRGQAEQVRITGPLIALWMLLFSLPVFLFAPDRPASGIGAMVAVRQGLATLWATLQNARAYPNTLRFLIAHMLYADGVNTLFAFGGIYAAGTFGMSLSEVIQFGAALNVTAGLGAFGFGWLDDRIGAKPTIVIALIGIIAVGVPLLLIESATWFWVLGALLGIFFGPAQAASRSLMARLCPPEMETEMFGLYALSGKATAFIGPWLVGAVALSTGNQRLGMAVVLPFIAVGGLLLLGVKTNVGNGASR
ncbi:MAG: MFS transporter [Alphaproteobacteria bacterium]|nr:MFS transporter [Alphaproteobacteria bacterium]